MRWWHAVLALLVLVLLALVWVLRRVARRQRFLEAGLLLAGTLLEREQRERFGPTPMPCAHRPGEDYCVRHGGGRFESAVPCTQARVQWWLEKYTPGLLARRWQTYGREDSQ